MGSLAIVIAWNKYILFRPCLVTSRISKNLMCLLAPAGDKSSGRTLKKLIDETLDFINFFIFRIFCKFLSNFFVFFT